MLGVGRPQPLARKPASCRDGLACRVLRPVKIVLG